MQNHIRNEIETIGKLKNFWAGVQIPLIAALVLMFTAFSALCFL